MNIYQFFNTFHRHNENKIFSGNHFFQFLFRTFFVSFFSFFRCEWLKNWENIRKYHSSFFFWLLSFVNFKKKVYFSFTGKYTLKVNLKQVCYRQPIQFWNMLYRINKNNCSYTRASIGRHFKKLLCILWPGFFYGLSNFSIITASEFSPTKQNTKLYERWRVIATMPRGE